ncbi:MAG: hypothetical protein AB7E55_32555 [Pigmentiphaga sp.]
MDTSSYWTEIMEHTQEILSTPGANMPTPLCVTETVLEAIPGAVQRRLRCALSILHEVRSAAEACAGLDAKLNSGGRYEADVFVNRAEEIKLAQTTLAVFRKFAQLNGVDGQQVIDHFGGESEVSPSPAAQAYLRQADAHMPMNGARL